MSLHEDEKRFNQLRELLANEVAEGATPSVLLPQRDWRGSDKVVFQYNGWALVITPDGWYWVDTTG